MTISIAPPPLQVPSDFATDKSKSSFFSGLLNTIYQLWTAVYSLRTTARVTTTDATVTGIIQIPIADGYTTLIVANIVARRTGGSSGVVGDSAFYVLTGAYKNVAGVLTGIGSPSLISGEDQAAWSVNFTTSGNNAVVTVTGAAGNDVTWEGTFSTYKVGA